LLALWLLRSDRIADCFANFGAQVGVDGRQRLFVKGLFLCLCEFEICTILNLGDCPVAQGIAFRSRFCFQNVNTQFDHFCVYVALMTPISEYASSQRCKCSDQSASDRCGDCRSPSGTIAWRLSLLGFVFVRRWPPTLRIRTMLPRLTGQPFKAAMLA
jgi:hypothetical protein